MTDPSAAQKRMLAKMGLAMPDGSYYIRKGVIGASDLDNAIHAVGRGVAAGDDGDAIRRHIMKRASDLKLSDKIPDTWNPDGSLKHSDADILEALWSLSENKQSEILEHFGVKGMRWGARKGASSATPPHPDQAHADAVKTQIKKHGLKSVSNKDLKALNERLQLESSHHRLTSGDTGAGQKFFDTYLKNELTRSAKREISDYAAKGAAHTATWLVKEGTKLALGTTTGVGRHA